MLPALQSGYIKRKKVREREGELGQRLNWIKALSDRRILNMTIFMIRRYMV